MRGSSVAIPLLSVLAVLAAFMASGVLRAEISAEEQRKRELFLRARESIEPVPAATPAPTPVKPRPRPRPTPEPVEQDEEVVTLPPPKPSTPRPTPKPKAVETPRPTPPPQPKATPRPAPPAPAGNDQFVLPPPMDADRERPTPTPRRDREEPTPEPREVKPDEIVLPPARPAATPAVAATPSASPPAAPITVEKSGLGEEEGLAPLPKPERRGFLGLGGPRYRYLTRSVRAAIDNAPVKKGRWKYIVIHNSGTRQGNAKIFNNYHKNVRRMQNGLAYHFVIGNGTSSGNGEIEIGSRWTRQINGGHVASDFLNNIAIGICFVGDFNRDKPTTAQLEALDELVRYLRSRVGRSKGKVVIVKAHREINPKPTDCPGNRFPYAWMHRRFD